MAHDCLQVVGEVVPEPLHVHPRRRVVGDPQLDALVLPPEVHAAGPAGVAK